MADTASPDQRGLYCSTSGTFFTDKDALADHYKSDFHRYNLKRKIANLPPVTREWFDARKEKLASTTGTAVTKTWLDPLTKKKFSSENTYKAYVNSKKYKELVKQSGKPAPEAIVKLRRAEAPVVSTSAPQQLQTKAPYTIKAANGAYDMMAASKKQKEDEDLDGYDESGWETASDEDEEAHFDAAAVAGSAGGEAQSRAVQEVSPAPDASQDGDAEEMEEWDVRCSLFDGHMSRDMEANLEYMWKKFGFYFPEADLLRDPEGLLKYLGAKLQYGRVPLYVSGEDASARQFPSLHAVQRHMADTGRFKMAWEDNEEEYADFYDFGDEDMEEDADGRELALAGSLDAEQPTAVGGYELVVGGDVDGAGGQVLGHRQFARYYRQKYRAGDPRHSIAINRVLAQYRLLGIGTQTEPTNEVKRQQRNALKKFERMRLRTEMRANVNRNLPRNVPY
ncbi:g8373 [Coccomyxa elongata]